MVRKLVAALVIGSLAVVTGQAGATSKPVHLAKIKITKITIKGGDLTVKVSITGFAVPGHWDLSYKLIGGFGGKPFGGKGHLLRGWQPRFGTPSTSATLPTNVRPGERWQLTASLVDPKHKVFSAKRYPNATFTAKKTVTVR